MVDILHLYLFKNLPWMGLISLIPFGFFKRQLLLQNTNSIFLINFDHLSSHFTLVLLLSFQQILQLVLRKASIFTRTAIIFVSICSIFLLVLFLSRVFRVRSLIKLWSTLDKRCLVAIRPFRTFILIVSASENILLNLYLLLKGILHLPTLILLVFGLIPYFTN